MKTHSKFEGYSYWPVQVSKVEKDIINCVYFGCGRVGIIPKASINDLLPSTNDNVKILKFDKIKSAKLKNALKVAKDYM